MTSKHKITFNFPDGTSDQTECYTSLNLLAHAQILEKSLYSKCGGHCECGTCRIRVLSGSLSPMGAEEEKLLKKCHVDPSSEIRLACQCFPEANSSIEIEVPQSKFHDARLGKG